MKHLMVFIMCYLEAQLRLGWQKYKEEIRVLSIAKDKPVLFTEYGYRNNYYTAKKPWLVDHWQDEVNMDSRTNATQAIFEEFWSEDWFAGGFVWKWFVYHERAGGFMDNRFTPNKKPYNKLAQK